MDTLVFDNNYLDNLFRDNSEDIETYALIKKIIKDYGYNYIDFIYNIFLIYSSIYINIKNRESRLNYIEIHDIINKLNKYKKNIIMDNIVISDVYDILYNIYTSEYNFDTSLYDFIYASLVNVENSERTKLTNENIIEKLEDIMNTLDSVFVIINSSIFNYVSSKEKDFDGVIIIYLEMVNNHLFLNMVV